MRFRTFFEDYTPSQKEIKRFNDVDTGFKEVSDYELLLSEMKEYKKKLKFPFHDKLNFILKHSNTLYELLSNLKRFTKELPEIHKINIEKTMNKYKE